MPRARETVLEMPRGVQRLLECHVGTPSIKLVELSVHKAFPFAVAPCTHGQVEGRSQGEGRGEQREGAKE